MVNSNLKFVKTFGSLFVFIFFLTMIVPVYAQDKIEYKYDGGTGADSGLVPCGRGGDTSKMCEFKHLFDLIGRIMGFLLYYIMLPVAALSFGIAGFMYMFSGGDPGKRKTD